MQNIFISDNKNNKNKNSLYYTSMWECMQPHRLYSISFNFLNDGDSSGYEF